MPFLSFLFGVALFGAGITAVFTTAAEIAVPLLVFAVAFIVIAVVLASAEEPEDD